MGIADVGLAALSAWQIGYFTKKFVEESVDEAQWNETDWLKLQEVVNNSVNFFQGTGEDVYNLGSCVNEVVQKVVYLMGWTPVTLMATTSENPTQFLQRYQK